MEHQEKVFSFMKEATRLLDCGRADIANLGPSCRNSGEVQQVVDKYRELLFSLPATMLPHSDTMPLQSKKLIVDSMILRLSRDTDPDSRNLSLLLMEACARALPSYSASHSATLCLTLVTTVCQPDKRAVDHCLMVAAMLAAVRCSLVAGGRIEEDMEEELRACLQECVTVFSMSSLVLSRLCQLLLQAPSLLPVSDDDKNELNVALVCAVGMLPRINVQTMEHMANLGCLMYSIWNQSSLHQIFGTLKIIYTTISSKNSGEHLSPAVAHLLTLVPENVVQNLAPHILNMPECNSKQHFKNVLSRLSVWLVGWPGAQETLLFWLHILVRIMVRNGMEGVVEEVAQEVVPKLTVPMRMPLIRNSLLTAATLLLLSCRHSAVAYRLVADSLINWAALLRSDASDAEPIQRRMALLCHALRDLHPREHDVHQHVMKAVEEFPIPTRDEVRAVLELHCCTDAIHADATAANTAQAQEGYVPTQAELPSYSVLPRVGLPAGLENIGSTCYYNAIMQALFATDMFRERLVRLPTVSAAHLDLQQLFSVLLFSQDDSIEPCKEVVRRAAPEYFEPGQQHDASEFMGYLLDSLKESEIKYCAAQNLEQQDELLKQEQRQMQVPGDAPVVSRLEDDESCGSRKDKVEVSSLAGDNNSCSASLNRCDGASLGSVDTSRAAPSCEPAMANCCITPASIAARHDARLPHAESNEEDSLTSTSSGTKHSSSSESSSFEEYSTVKDPELSSGSYKRMQTQCHQGEPPFLKSASHTSTYDVMVSSISSEESGARGCEDETMQTALLDSFARNNGNCSDSSSADSMVVLPERPLKRKGCSSSTDDEDIQKSSRGEVEYYLPNCDAEASTTTVDGASDDNSDSGISIQDDAANSIMDTASTVGGVTEEEEDMEEEEAEQQLIEQNRTEPSEHLPEHQEQLPEHQEQLPEHQEQLIDQHVKKNVAPIVRDEHMATVVQRTFGGETVRLTCCRTCYTISENYDHSVDLKVSFEDCAKKNSLVTLDDLIIHSLKKQELVGSEQYYCEVCKGKQDAEIYTAVIKAPEFLILTQNRFIYNSESRQESKILTRVEFQEMLDLPVWELDNLKQHINSGMGRQSSARVSTGTGWPHSACITTSSNCSISGQESASVSTNKTVDSSDQLTSGNGQADSVGVTTRNGDVSLSPECSYSKPVRTCGSLHPFCRHYCPTPSPSFTASVPDVSQDCAATSLLPGRTKKMTIDKHQDVEASNGTEGVINDEAVSLTDEAKVLLCSKCRAENVSTLEESLTDEAKVLLCSKCGRGHFSSPEKSLTDEAKVLQCSKCVAENFSSPEKSLTDEAKVLLCSKCKAANVASPGRAFSYVNTKVRQNLDTPPSTPEKCNNFISPSDSFQQQQNLSRNCSESIISSNCCTSENASTWQCSSSMQQSEGLVCTREGLPISETCQSCNTYRITVPHCNSCDLDSVPMQIEYTGSTPEKTVSSSSCMPSLPSSVVCDSDLKQGDTNLTFDETVDDTNSSVCIDDCSRGDIRESSRIASPSLMEGHISSSAAEPGVSSLDDGGLSSINCAAKVTEQEATEDQMGCVNIRYVLYGIVVHSGKISRAGHYYSYTRSSSDAVRDALASQEGLPSSSEWVELNDNKACSTSFHDLKASLTRSTAASSPYLMFYQRVPVVPASPLPPNRHEASLSSLPKHLQDTVRSHLFQQRRRARVGGASVTRGGASGPGGGASGSGGGFPGQGGGANRSGGGNGCGEGNAFNVMGRFIC